MRILFINNDGGGFADHIEVETGTTVAELFGQRLPGRKAEDFLIRVNRQPASKDQLLQQGDRVSMTPVKIEGARPSPDPIYVSQAFPSAMTARMPFFRKDFHATYSRNDSVGAAHTSHLRAAGRAIDPGAASILDAFGRAIPPGGSAA